MERSDCRSYLSPDPWQLAKERYAEDLSKEEKAIFNGASAASLETYFYDASATEKINQANSKSRALLVKIRPFIASIEEYGKALDVYANITPLILGPLWGSIRVVLHVEFSIPPLSIAARLASYSLLCDSSQVRSRSISKELWICSKG